MKQQTQTAGVQQTDEAKARRVGRHAPKTAADVLAMQQLIGNRAVQAKLRVGPVDDPFEREADAMAEAVMTSAPANGVQREGAPEEEDEVQMKPLAAGITPLAQREALPEEEELQRQALPEEEELQAKRVQREGDGSFEASAQVEQRLARSKGGGSALPSATRAEMEGRFGTDFSGVRVHTDGEAAQLNHDLSARAFTHGSDVYFGEGQFAPSGGEGKRLLAHELTHVVQQGAGVKSKTVRRDDVGPQSYAPASPGSEAIDPQLRQQNRITEQGMLNEAKALKAQGDLRWFFAFAHGTITRLINANLSSFQRPNALLRFNIHFAEAFIQALQGVESPAWTRAFRVCKSLQRTSQNTIALVGEAEFCGAAMANVHINVDISNAINSVGCIPPADYGNMLAFVNQGSLAALTQLRGRAAGAAEFILQYFAAPLINLNVETWRNSAYQAICNTEVPKVESNFSSTAQRKPQTPATYERHKLPISSEANFDGGKFAPASGDSTRLPAHELTHVVQQGGQALLNRQPVVDASVDDRNKDATNLRSEFAIPQKGWTATTNGEKRRVDILLLPQKRDIREFINVIKADQSVAKLIGTQLRRVQSLRGNADLSLILEIAFREGDNNIIRKGKVDSFEGGGLDDLWIHQATSKQRKQMRNLLQELVNREKTTTNQKEKSQIHVSINMLRSRLTSSAGSLRRGGYLLPDFPELERAPVVANERGNSVVPAKLPGKFALEAYAAYVIRASDRFLAKLQGLMSVLQLNNIELSLDEIRYWTSAFFYLPGKASTVLKQQITSLAAKAKAAQSKLGIPAAPSEATITTGSDQLKARAIADMATCRVLDRMMPDLLAVTDKQSR